MTQQIINVRVRESFQVYNHDGSELLAEVNEGETLEASLYEETEEYFAKDGKGREVFVGELNVGGNLIVDELFELLGGINNDILSKTSSC